MDLKTKVAKLMQMLSAEVGSEPTPEKGPIAADAILNDMARLSSLINFLYMNNRGEDAHRGISSLIGQLEMHRLSLVLQQLEPAVAAEMGYKECVGGYEKTFYPYGIYRLDASEVKSILCNEYDMPADAFFAEYEDICRNQIDDELDEVEDAMFTRVVAAIADANEDELVEPIEMWVRDTFYPYPDDKATLDQTYHCCITMDTGDGKYDFVLNSRYPSSAAAATEPDPEAPIEEEASIVWLSKTQGYSEPQLRAALCEGDISDPHGYLESVRQEMANTSTSTCMVTFLVELSLRDILAINTKMRNGDTDAELVLGKDTVTGLYDPWNGAGGPFEIELEKDVVVPVKYIRECMPDGCSAYPSHRYSVDSTYGMCGSAWKDTFKGFTEEDAAAAKGDA